MAGWKARAVNFRQAKLNSSKQGVPPAGRNSDLKQAASE
jgi:hypothetical protein